MFLAAARALAQMVSEEDLAAGSVYPPLTAIRDVSRVLALTVAEEVYAQDLAREPRPERLEQAIKDWMYDPTY